MAQGSTKKWRNKKMACTHHNNAMISAHNIKFSICSAHVSHFFLFPYSLVLPWVIPNLKLKHLGNALTSIASPYSFVCS